jgi:hypothetical protein
VLEVTESIRVAYPTCERSSHFGPAGVGGTAFLAASNTDVYVW